MESSRTKAIVLAGALWLPLAGLALLLAVPDLDVHWEHHPSHFWLVLSVAFIDSVLGIAMSEAATRWLRWALIALLVAWAAASLSGVSLLRGPAPSEAPTLLRILAPVSIRLYVFAAARYLAVYARRRRPLPLAVATAFILLAEAVLTIIVARSWNASWWEWHVLMAVAFLIVLLTARAEYQHEGSITAAFGGLYMERTLERIDRRQADSLAAMVTSIRSGEPLAPVVEGFLAEG